RGPGAGFGPLTCSAGQGARTTKRRAGPATPAGLPGRLNNAYGLAISTNYGRGAGRRIRDSPQVQSMLRNLARVLTAMTQIQPDVVTAVYHVKNTPVPAF